MPYCSECGSEITGEEQYCPDCGANLKPEHKNASTNSLPDPNDISLIFDSELEKKVAYGGAGIAIIGAFLPWASAFGLTVRGIDGDGLITLILSIALAVAIYSLGWERRTILSALVIGGIVVLIPLISLSGVSSIGIYVTILGGGAMVTAGQSGYRRQQS